MSGRLELRVDGIPATKGSWRILTRPTLRLIPDNPGEPEWAERVGWLARAVLRGQLADAQRYRVRAVFTLPPAKGKRNRRDLDKLVRSILDALTGIVWLDDEQVDEILTCKEIGPRPGVDIVIEPLGPIVN